MEAFRGYYLFNEETISLNDIIADREGYIVAYLSNESNTPNYVHFDDFTVYHGKTNIVQANDYYPFGLSSTSYARTASLFNPYLYNQSSRLEEETEWYHTPFRKYDASIGRFTGVDALASSMASINSYHYAYNNPVNFSDPAGLRPRPTHDDMNPSGESSSGGFMRTLRRIAAAFGYGGGGISGYKESSGSNGTFSRGGTSGQDDFMSNPFAIGTDAYANEQAAQEDISNLRRRQRDEALANLGVQFVEGTFEEVLVASSNENQQGLDGTAYSPLYNVETIFKATGRIDPADITAAAQNALDYVNGFYTKAEAACNIGVQCAFEELTGRPDFGNMTANQIVEYLHQSETGEWSGIAMKNVQSVVNNGGIVIAGTTNPSGSGHVVLLVPGTEGTSGSWGGLVPVAMDTGPNKKWVSKGINYSWSAGSKNNIRFFRFVGQ